MNIINAIKERHSVRTYEAKEIEKEIIEKIEKYLENIESPFKNKVKIRLVRAGYSNESKKLGTYGVIKGANYFLVAVCEGKDFDFTALGYELEKVILYCTSLGLGTCWIGGTFNKGNFAKAVNLNEKEILPIISPLGYEADKKSFIASIFSKSTGKRKDFEELFFNGNFNTPLTKEEAGDYKEVLEMVRLAPSAVNKQPWRILRENNNYHFYIDGKGEFPKIDMGIALSHFHLMCDQLGIVGAFENNKPEIESKYEYLISWCEKIK